MTVRPDVPHGIVAGLFGSITQDVVSGVVSSADSTSTSWSTFRRPDAPALPSPSYASPSGGARYPFAGTICPVTRA